MVEYAARFILKCVNDASALRRTPENITEELVRLGYLESGGVIKSSALFDGLVRLGYLESDDGKSYTVTKKARELCVMLQELDKLPAPRGFGGDCEG